MRTVFVAMALLVASGLARTAEACQCVPNGPVCEAAWEADLVFAGRVEAIELVQPKGTPRPFATRRVRFRISEPFMGASTSEIDVDTGAGGGDCGYRFREGREYLIYARRNPQTGRFTTSICSRTKPIASAAEDLAYLRAAVSGQIPSAGRIMGTIERVDRNLANGTTRRRPAGRVPVVIERDGQETRATTDAQGRFAVPGFPPGSYRVRLDVPSGQEGTVTPDAVELKDARGCASVRGAITYDGRVAGRVLASSGRPVPGLTVELTLPAGLDDPVGPERIRALTDSLGRYELRTVPPGRFIVGINTQPRVDGPPLPRAFHPGVETLESATRVALTGGERKTIADFVLPHSLTLVRVTGIVIDPSGVPAAGALVYLKGPSEKDYILGEPVLTDSTGTFTLSAFDGVQYRLFAQRTTGERRHESSDQRLLTASTSLAPFKLALRVHY